MVRFQIPPTRGCKAILDTGFYYIWDPDIPANGAWIKGGFPIEKTGETISDEERTSIEEFLNSSCWSYLPVSTWGVESSGWWWSDSYIQFAVGNPEMNSWAGFWFTDLGINSSVWLTEGEVDSYSVCSPNSAYWIEFNFNYTNYHFFIGMSDSQRLEVGVRSEINIEKVPSTNWISGNLSEFTVI